MKLLWKFKVILVLSALMIDMSLYVYRSLTVEEAVEIICPEDDQIPSGSDDENLSEEDDEVEVQCTDLLAEDESDEEVDDVIPENESNSSESEAGTCSEAPTKKKTTKRYNSFLQHSQT